MILKVKTLQHCTTRLLAHARSARIASFTSTALRTASSFKNTDWQLFELDPKQQQHQQQPKILASSTHSKPNKLQQQRWSSTTDKKVDKFKEALVQDDLEKAVPLYRALRDRGVLTKKATPSVADGECSMLLRILHTGLRLNQGKLHRFRFHGSASKKKALQEQRAQLLTVNNEIANDLYEGRTCCRPWGAMHLLTAHLTAGQPSEGVALWRLLIEEDSHCREVFLAPRVVGSAIRLLHSAGEPLEEIEKFYDTACAQETAAGDLPSSNLALEMVPVWLHYGRVSKALQEFEQLITDSNKGLTESGAQTLYNCIIGQCVELDAVTAIVDTVFAGTAPFNIKLHPVEFARFMQRFAQHTDNNVEAVKVLWEKYFEHVPPAEPEWRLMVVTKVLFDTIITKHPIATPEAVALLRGLLESYKRVRRGANPGSDFVVGLLLRFNDWSDRDATLSIVDLFRVYKLPIGPVEARAVLMSFKGIDVEPELISKYWDIIDYSPPQSKKSSGEADSNTPVRDVALTSLDIDALWKCTVQSNRSERIVFFKDVFGQILSVGPSRLSDSELLTFSKLIKKKDYSRLKILKNILENNNVVVNLKNGEVHRSVFVS